MESDDDILSCFIEDAREHLTGIEESLLDMEQAGAGADPDLVNTVFRAAHSIKGGAGFLGLEKARDLAHRLETLLHMMRTGEMVPGPGTVSPLLAGFDLLRALVESGKDGNGRDISGTLDALAGLVSSHLPEQERPLMGSKLDISLPGTASFSLDMLTLRQSLQGGKNLYLVEYDLIHDVHARGKTPLDILSVMESSGLILDSRIDLDAVGDLDGPLTNRIPFHLIFATIVEPDVVGYLFSLDPSRIRVIDPQALQPPKTEGRSPDGIILELTGDLDAPALDKLKPEVLNALASGSSLTLDLGRAGLPGAAFVQFVCAAHLSFRDRGKTLALSGVSTEARKRLDALGLGPAPPACAAGGCPMSNAGALP
ncbi:MAG: Hpt domain-containing protein [Thermodesulfobacteriota bacterium]